MVTVAWSEQGWGQLWIRRGGGVFIPFPFFVVVGVSCATAKLAEVTLCCPHLPGDVEEFNGAASSATPSPDPQTGQRSSGSPQSSVPFAVLADDANSLSIGTSCMRVLLLLHMCKTICEAETQCGASMPGGSCVLPGLLEEGVPAANIAPLSAASTDVTGSRGGSVEMVPLGAGAASSGGPGSRHGTPPPLGPVAASSHEEYISISMDATPAAKLRGNHHDPQLHNGQTVGGSSLD